MNSKENYITIEKTEEIQSLFFDTYAFLEILKGSENYEKYLNANIVTTKLNIFELYLKILREETQENADKAMKQYYFFAKDFDENAIKEAAKLKITLNKRDISMTGCIGYSVAKQLGIKFLTGDNAFKDLENVEYVR